MAVATLITNSAEAEGMIRWSLLFALAQENDKLVLLHTEALTEKEIQKHLDLWSEDFPTLEDISVKNIGAEIDEDALLDSLDDLSVALLVLGQNRVGETTDRDLHLIRKIFDKAFCDSVILRLGGRRVEESDQVLVPTAGGPHSQVALKLASRLAKRHDGEIVPLFIESEIGEEDGRELGHRILGRFIDRAGLDRKDSEHIKPQIVISNDVGKGIASAAAEKPYDLVLVGASNSMVVKRKLFGILPSGFFKGEDAMTVALIRKRRPVGHRVRQRMERFLALKIPQLNPGDRIALFDKLQTQSVWSFDFMALILLSTGIASLGLIQSSPAVVIGAMLVAPLMTPLLGSGLSLVQGNLPLMKECVKAIFLGFLAAILFGTLMGYFAPIDSLTSELAARGKPNLLDFGVAAMSGIAASFCIARPALSSALAGVAIAAALVPPIATVGISMALQQWHNATGAALLFGTNVVAIILASTLTFFAMGIRGQVGAKVLWARRTLVLLFAVLGMLLVPLSAVLVSKAGKVAEQKSEAANVSSKAGELIVAHLQEGGFEPADLEISKFSAETPSISIECQVAAAKPISKDVVDQIIAKLKAEFKKEQIILKIRTYLQIGSKG